MKIPLQAQGMKQANQFLKHFESCDKVHYSLPYFSTTFTLSFYSCKLVWTLCSGLGQFRDEISRSKDAGYHTISRQNAPFSLI